MAHPKTVKTEALKLRRRGYGYRVIAAELNICAWTVRHWVKHIAIEKREAQAKGQKYFGKPFSRLKSKNAIRKAIIAIRGHKCEKCKRSKWMGLPIMLEVEHIDGNNKNNVADNLALLCCNCHAQTPTWKKRKPK